MRAAKGKAGALQCCYDGDDDDDYDDYYYDDDDDYHDYYDDDDDDYHDYYDDHAKKNYLHDGENDDFGVHGCIGMYLTTK